MPETSTEEVTADMVTDRAGNVYVTGTAGSGALQNYVTIKYNSNGIRQWIARYNSASNGADIATAIAVDTLGNVYVTGSGLGAATTDYATVKYNAFGLQQWVALYNGPGNGGDIANAIAVDGSGNVYVTGGSAGSGTFNDYATVKYNSSGVQQWVTRYAGPAIGNDIAYAITVDGSGNVYVTGAALGQGNDIATIKYNTSGVQQWVGSYMGPNSGGADLGRSIAVDGLGNVYVTGESEGMTARFDFATLKYNSSGIQQWVARYNGPANLHDFSTALVIDGSAVYVTGYSDGSGTSQDYATVKYNTSGVQQWVARYNGPAGISDFAYALTVDLSGNTYVTGQSAGSGTSGDFATIKYNSSGVEQWVARYNGPANGNDVAVAIAVDVTGNVRVAGTSVGNDNTNDFTTILYNSAGSQQWVIRPGFELVNSTSAHALDRQGNTYVTGSVSGFGTDLDYGTFKYDPSGNQLWLARYDGPASSTDIAYAIAIDSMGNAYVTGGSRGLGTEMDYATIKYNSSGGQQWVARYNGPAFGIDNGAAVAVDNAGTVYVAGTSMGSGSVLDYATLKYNASGQLQWFIRYNGQGNGADIVSALSLDGAGNVYVAGTSNGTATMSDYATVKYNTSGVEQWVARYNGPGNSIDSLRAIATDAAANIYVTGWSMGSGTNRDFATIKYNSSGVEQWVARYDDPASSVDEASAIAVDRFGNVYVTGYSTGAGTGNDFTTIKYSSSGIQEWVSLYNGPTNSVDEATHIALDGGGRAYVTGRSTGPGTGYDFATVKYGSGGTQEWMIRYKFDDTGIDDVPAGISVDGSGDVYVAGTSGQSIGSKLSIVKYVQPGFVSVGDIPALPSRFTLSQNYPNPFNPVTRIPFGLSVSGRTTLKVFDILGREVATLVDEQLMPGNHEVRFDAGKLSSGLYFYRLKSGSAVLTRKLLLIR
ncbi:MAG: SBBP repeat-containing protein [Bacteroidota bacterium]